MTTISSAEVLKQFDSLVEQGELFYTPSKPIILRDDGLDVRLTQHSSAVTPFMYG